MHYGVDTIFPLLYGMVVLYGFVGYFAYEMEKMYWNDWGIS